MLTLNRIFLISVLLGLGHFSYANLIYASPMGMGSGSKLSPAGLQTALDKARTNGMEDTILLQVGVYNAASSTFSYDTALIDGKLLHISGGWNSDYSSFTDNSNATLLDGGGVNTVVYFGVNKRGLIQKVVLEHLSIKNGYSLDHGAGIKVYSGTTTAGDTGKIDLRLYKCDISDNTADGKLGGGIYIQGSLDIEKCILKNNVASNGGAIFNSAWLDGDQSIQSKVNDCYFEGNKNTSNQGSSIWHNVHIFIIRSEFKGIGQSQLLSPGSPLWGNSGSTTEVDQCSFSEFNIQYWGSAIQSFDGNLLISNSEFINNHCGSGSGYGAVAYYHNNGPTSRTVSVLNCTFKGNTTSSGFYSAIHVRPDANDQMSVQNTLIWGNGNSPLVNQGPKTSSNSISFCDVQGGITSSNFFDGGNNINNDPLFTGTDDLRLLEGSPCINAGDPAGSYALEDLFGVPRVQWDTVDIGAYEYNRSPIRLDTIEDITIYKASPYQFTLVNGVFDDPDGNQYLQYDLQILDGSDLPQWINFNNGTGGFTGTPVESSALSLVLTAIDPGGLEASDTFILNVIPTVSVGELSIQPSIVFPNPSNGVIRFVFEETYQSVQFYSLNGVLVKSFEAIVSGQELDVRDLPKGAYYVVLRSSQNLERNMIILY